MELPVARGNLMLGIDTCGPSGSVALGRLAGAAVEMVGQKELAGRSYSATLIAAVGELLSEADVRLSGLAAIVAVNGPGSFTGVRVGLSAVKGLAEVSRIPVLAVSRLEVLARKAGLGSAALDAHRHEVFLRLAARELLAGAEELEAMRPAPQQIAVCDDAAALLRSLWPQTELVSVTAPSAGDALQLCAGRMAGGDYVDFARYDFAQLDGHYLRRSDAEIFGEQIVGESQAAKPGAR